ncbi:MAG: 4-hydroxy-3-methylbut-2-enyl diphosphate reductase [Candidatus Omnitrophica bacterium]|nr:4-hydroxy-3-methylbut-2-enyl diphosphate reductase [Candidatus Gastranaerophilales bacterium]MDD5070817.1 4-hydroxy-3-methylbut-2-enyl diphosphate reductase [Candidatus Omnitrophota bacterium]
MKINLAKSCGFCFGVNRAITIAENLANNNENVEMLGDIVHNEEVVKKIRNKGIKKIKTLSDGKGKTLLIRAHGIDKSTLEKAISSGYRVVDATCQMVKEIHNIVRKMEEKNFTIIVIGDKLHDEVKGIVGQLEKKAFVIDKPNSIPIQTIKKIKKAAVVAQSTQDIENVKQIITVLKKNIKEIKFFNTICKPTRTKQNEIKKMPLENDVILVIGSKTSANTKRLYQISKSLNKNSYWINSKDDIHKIWFEKAKTIGVTSGASTPKETTEGIISFLNRLLEPKASKNDNSLNKQLKDNL